MSLSYCIRTRIQPHVQICPFFTINLLASMVLCACPQGIDFSNSYYLDSVEPFFLLWIPLFYAYFASFFSENGSPFDSKLLKLDNLFRALLTEMIMINGPALLQLFHLNHQCDIKFHVLHAQLQGRNNTTSNFMNQIDRPEYM